eukprot:scaffold71562_cov60-Attheya_sp.AAC.2
MAPKENAPYDPESLRTPLMSGGTGTVTYDGIASREDVTSPSLSDSSQQPRQGLTAGFDEFASSHSYLRVLALYIFVYLLLAVVAYHWIFEDWSIVDSIYFAVVMFTTIGYGDMSPSTQASQLFTIFFALYGIVILGLFLGIMGEVLVEAQQGAVKAVRERAQKRMMEMFSHENDASAGARASAILESEDDDTVKEEEENVENHLCIDIHKALVRMAPILSSVVVAALLIGHAEGWTIITSLYYCVITSTTVGFGDEAPQKEWVRIVAIFFMPVAVAVFGEVLGRIAQIYMDRSTQQAEKQFLQRELTLSDLAIMDTDGDGEVSLAEFLYFMLVAMQKVDKESLDELKNLFQSLDADNSGSLQKEDLLILANRNKQSTSTSPSPSSP